MARKAHKFCGRVLQMDAAKSYAPSHAWRKVQGYL